MTTISDFGYRFDAAQLAAAHGSRRCHCGGAIVFRVIELSGSIGDRVIRLNCADCGMRDLALAEAIGMPLDQVYGYRHAEVELTGYNRSWRSSRAKVPDGPCSDWHAPIAMALCRDIYMTPCVACRVGFIYADPVGGVGISLWCSHCDDSKKISEYIMRRFVAGREKNL